MNILGPIEMREQAVHFCGCIMDSETQTLQTETDFVRLRSKLWYVLYELVNRPNKLVSRDALIQHIWHGNVYTGEQGLTHAICHLRRILKKYQINAKIITLPKKGYILQVNSQQIRPFENVTGIDTPRKSISFGKQPATIHQHFKYPSSF